MDDAKAEEELAAMENIVIPGGNIDAGPQVVPQQPAEEAKLAEPDAAEMEELEAMMAI